MGGHGSHPLEWTMLALVVVAYAHVILELAVAGLALAITVGIVTAAPARTLLDRVMSHQNGRRRPRVDDAGPRGSTSEAAADGRAVDRPGKHDT